MTTDSTPASQPVEAAALSVEKARMRIEHSATCNVTNVRSLWRNEPHWDVVWPDGEYWCYPTAEEAADRAVEVTVLREERGPGWFWTRTEWSEWSNELAMLIPEDDFDRYSNPDGAQESCIAAVLRAYVEERALRPGVQP